MGRRDAVALTILVAIWAAVLWSAFDPAGSFALYMDNEFFVGTVLSAMSGAFSGGEWPLRMTTALGGLPTYNLAQLSVFYPFYFAPLPLFETPLDAVHSMHWITLMHILLFAVNMFVLLRVIGTTRIAAVTGAALVAFGANSLAYAVWMNIVTPYAWLPLYLAGLIGVLEKRASAKYAAMAVGAIVLLALASPSQPLIHAVLLTSVLIPFHWRYNRVSAAPHAIRESILRLASIALIAFLLAAPAVLPTFAEFRDMIRWIGHYPAVTGFQRIPFDAFLIEQLSIPELGGVLAKIAPHSVGSQFAGPVALTLAVLPLLAQTRSWVTLAMAAIAVYALASATGSNLGLAYVNYVLPLVNKIREPSRFLFLFQLAIGILAAQGIDELRRIVTATQPAPVWRRLMTLVSGIALASLMAASTLQDKGAVIASSLLADGLLIGLTAIGVVVSRTHWRLRGEAVAIGWSVAALVVLITNVPWKPPPIAASHYLANDGISLDVAIQRVADLDPRRDYRLVFEGTIDKQMASMLASYQNVRTLNSYFNPAPLRQFQELYHHGPRKDNYLQILGARYLLCRDCGGAEYRGFKFREHLSGYDLHEAADALPYARVMQRVDGRFDSLNDFIDQAATYDLGRGLLFVETDATIAIGASSPVARDCLVRENIRKINRIRQLVSCQAPGVLILNEFYAEPWHVTVNGAVSPVLRVNGNQIGVQVGPGAQVVEFVYRPRSFVLSLCLAAIGLAFVLMWAMRTRYEKRLG